MDRRLLVCGTLLLIGSGTAACREIEPIEPAPRLTSLGAEELARVELGQRLFFDPRLSSDGTVACATCHVPAEGGDDGRRVAVGVRDQRGERNAPTVLNVGLKEHLFWDGRAATLREQCLIPLRAEAEMAAVDGAVLDYLRGDASYPAMFAAAFGDRPIGMDELAQAIATYERMLLTPTRVDAYLMGDEAALDERERRGLEHFQSSCAFCHDGPGIGGARFEKLGDEIAWPRERTHDLGRFEITRDPDDKLVFVVPQLRGVAETAPYFHDGSVATLEEAVVLMARHQVGEELSRSEVVDLVAFLEALSGAPEPQLLTDPTAASE